MLVLLIRRFHVFFSCKDSIFDGSHFVIKKTRCIKMKANRLSNLRTEISDFFHSEHYSSRNPSARVSLFHLRSHDSVTQPISSHNFKNRFGKDALRQKCNQQLSSKDNRNNSSLDIFFCILVT